MERNCFNCMSFPNCRLLKEMTESLNDEEKSIFMSLHGDDCEYYSNRT
jgi:hypothetical protein